MCTLWPIYKHFSKLDDVHYPYYFYCSYKCAKNRVFKFKEDAEREQKIDILYSDVKHCQYIYTKPIIRVQTRIFERIERKNTYTNLLPIIRVADLCHIITDYI